MSISFKDISVKTSKKYKHYDFGKKDYVKDNKTILSGIDLEIKRGEFVVITGDNGAGKSTLLKAIIHDTDGLNLGGGLSYYGIDALDKRNAQKIRQDVGNVFQGYALIDSKTVKENIIYPLEVLGKKSSVDERENLVYRVCEYLGLLNKLDDYPHQLSGGQVQRTMIARSMVLEPSTYLVDEPTSNLDKSISRNIMRVYEDLNKQGKTVIMVTHHKELLSTENKRVIRLEDSKVEEVLNTTNQTTQ